MRCSLPHVKKANEMTCAKLRELCEKEFELEIEIVGNDIEYVVDEESVMNELMSYGEITSNEMKDVHDGKKEKARDNERNRLKKLHVNNNQVVQENKRVKIRQQNSSTEHGASSPQVRINSREMAHLGIGDDEKQHRVQTGSKRKGQEMQSETPSAPQVPPCSLRDNKILPYEQSSTSLETREDHPKLSKPQSIWKQPGNKRMAEEYDRGPSQAWVIRRGKVPSGAHFRSYLPNLCVLAKNRRGRPREIEIQLQSPDNSIVSAQILDHKKRNFYDFLQFIN